MERGWAAHRCADIVSACLESRWPGDKPWVTRGGRNSHRSGNCVLVRARTWIVLYRYKQVIEANADVQKALTEAGLEVVYKVFEGDTVAL